MSKDKFEDGDKPVAESVLHLLTSNSTKEPILALETSDKIILVTAAQPPNPPCYSGFWGLFGFSQKNLPNLQPYKLSIDVFTDKELTEAVEATTLRSAKISNDCAVLLESDMLDAAKVFATYNNACLLIVHLLRKCTDKEVREQWLNDILGVSSISTSTSTSTPAITRIG